MDFFLASAVRKKKFDGSQRLARGGPSPHQQLDFLDAGDARAAQISFPTPWEN